jgi:hypothetical protein
MVADAVAIGGEGSAVSAVDEQTWRNALEGKGKDWVTHQLRTRFGQPEDHLLDVVYAEPYPTREFCQRWCSSQDNKMFSMPTDSIVAIVILAVLVCFSILAVSSLQSHHSDHGVWGDRLANP